MLGLEPPHQERSARTLEAVLHAAETLMRQKSPTDVPIVEICRLSGVTTGAFYARFRDRTAMFRVLEERVYKAFEEKTPELGASGDLENELATLIEVTADLYRKHRGTLRALSVIAMGDPELAARVAAFNRRLMRRVVAALGVHRDVITHEDPETALLEATVWVVTILRQQILFGELGLRGVSARPDRLVKLALAYLTCSRAGQ